MMQTLLSVRAFPRTRLRQGMRLLAIAMMLFGLVLNPRSALAGAKPKAKAPVDELMTEALHLQEGIHGLRDWATQVSRKKAFKGLVKAGTLRGLYRQFETKLKGQKVAWVIARKDVSRNIATEAHFIEHNGSRSAGSQDVETTVRCYVQDSIAEFARAAPPGSMILCVGEITDIEFFRNFISLSVRASSVSIGNDEIEAWVGAQAKASK